MEFGDDRGAAGLDGRRGFVQCRPFLFRQVTARSPLIGSLRAPRLVCALCGGDRIVIHIGSDVGSPAVRTCLRC